MDSVVLQSTEEIVDGARQDVVMEMVQLREAALDAPDEQPEPTRRCHSSERDKSNDVVEWSRSVQLRESIAGGFL